MNKIVVSLDNLSRDYALQIAKDLKGKVWGFKVNDMLLKYGANLIYDLKSYGNVMADPKLFDVPSTMKNSIDTLLACGANIITVHCSSKYQPKAEIAQHLAGVTVLTSMTRKNVYKVYFNTIANCVVIFTINAIDAGYGYVVCSSEDLEHIKKYKITKICPGIRPSWYKKTDDQDRASTPQEAIKNGADLLVIGRPITHNKDYVEAVNKINQEINVF
jgi:orotidine-5'-phosphate decarboxylase